MYNAVKLHLRLVDKKILAIGILVTAAMMLMRDLGVISLNRYIFILFAAAVFFFGELEDIYLYMMFIASMHPGLPYSYIASIALTALLIKKRKFSVSLFPIIGIIVISVLELVNGTRGEFTFIELLKFLSMFLFFFLTLCDRDTIIQPEKGSNLFIAGFLVAVIDLWAQMLKQYSLGSILNLHVRFGNTRFILNNESEGMLLSYNVNMLGAICILCASISLLMMLKKSKYMLAYMIVFLIASITGFLTLSRATIIAFLIAIALFILFSGTNVKRRIFSLILIVVLFGIIYFVISNYFQSFYSYMLSRFRVSDITNGRYSLFNEYMTSATSSIDRILFGVGLQGYQIKSHVWNSCHNATQEVFVAWGIIGFVFFIICFVSIFRNQKRLFSSAMIINYLPVVIFIFLLQSSQGFSVRGNILLLIAAFGAIGINIKNDKVNVNGG